MPYAIRNFFIVLKGVAQGNKYYYLWLAFLFVCIGLGVNAYINQLQDGLILTAMRDQVSWGYYIANFTFLVGVAAAAVFLVVPAYLYHFKPIKEIVLFGELMAVSAVTMCILFVLVDMGRIDRLWHVMPVIGTMNFPVSMLSWDIIVLNGYLAINLCISLYALYKLAHDREYNIKIIKPLIMLSIPWAVSIHTVTAFLFMGLAARPFWNASILAPRFLASAFCAGPAIMLIVFQIVRKVSKIEIDNRAIFKIAELMAYAMGINLFLFGAEYFKEFYSATSHLAHMEYMYFGLHEHTSLVPYLRLAFFFNVTAFILFVLPKTRENFFTMNLACVLIIVGVYIEKGMGLSIPGFVPDVLGEIYEYMPTTTERLVSLGIIAIGMLLYTLLLKFAMPVWTGELRFYTKENPTAQ